MDELEKLQKFLEDERVELTKWQKAIAYLIYCTGHGQGKTFLVRTLGKFEDTLS